MFALPFADDFTLIGTTDENFVGSLDTVAPSAEEMLYLCSAVNEFFRDAGQRRPMWSGRSPACARSTTTSDGRDTPEDVTRDYRLVLDERYGDAPVLTVYGGKITTYRRLAEDALDKLAHFFQLRRRWTAADAAAGRRFSPGTPSRREVAQARRAWPFLGEREAWRLVRAYGTRLDRVLGEAKQRADLGPFFGPLSAAEVRYLMTARMGAAARRRAVAADQARAEAEQG